MGGFRPVAAECTSRAAPGAPSPECEEWRAGDAATAYQGCCRPDHTCGALVNLGGDLDLGCQRAEDFIADAGPGASCGPDAATD